MSKTKVPKVARTSEDIDDQNLQKLRTAFPNFVKDNKVDFDALKAFMNKDGILAGEEKYGLSWAGKSNAFKAIKTPATGTLVPQPKESKNWDETENIFIEGDNLEVLKLLQKHYREKIKMIYIDPPYNTGKDFVYKDNFTQGVSDYYEQTGQTKDSIKMTANTEKNGRYHSDWLTMMYPRLFLAKNLLKEDGVIFVSIDDHEVANLRLIMDEIFGEENFVASVIWERAYSPINLKKYFSENHDYVLTYAKSLNSIPSLNLSRNEESDSRYTNPDDDVRGPWKSTDFSVGPRVNDNVYEIKTPSGRIVLPPTGRSWIVSEDKYKVLNKDNRIWFGPDGNSVPSKKSFLSEVKGGITPMTLWKYSEVGHSQDATKKLKELFDEKSVFEYPKPVGLIERMIEISTSEKDVVLDFFAGSGTTAHAVMDLNKDGRNMKWICVQLPEVIEKDSEAYKVGYKTIADIARERIKRAGKKIQKGDIGFKSYKLLSSNYRQWNTITDKDDEKEILKQSKLFLEKPLIDNFDEESVVYEILLKEGFDLNAKIKQEKGELKPWVVEEENKKVVITFAKSISKAQIDKLELSENDVLVCFDNAINDTIKINIINTLNIKTI